jgi:branched-chain amino acid transport system ATP-binding protein
MLAVTDLHVSYGLSHVLFGVSLRAAGGEGVALLGRNGAGKSTTLKAIMGLVPPAAGHVRFHGVDLAGEPPHVICRRGIGFVPEDRRIFPELTVQENLEVGRRSRVNGGGGGWTRDRVLDLFPVLRGLRARRGDSLSGGEQQMLAIARTLMGNPTLLLLDEPSEGLAPLVVRTLADQLLRLKQEGVAMLLAEQNLAFASRVCDRAYIIERGRIQVEGDMAALLADEPARRAHLMI